jgi:hypothetical protein
MNKIQNSRVVVSISAWQASCKWNTVIGRIVSVSFVDSMEA